MTIKQALLRVTPWTICQCVTGSMQRDNRQSVLLLMQIHWEPATLPWGKPVSPLCRLTVTRLKFQNTIAETLLCSDYQPELSLVHFADPWTGRVFSNFVSTSFLRIKEWEVWRRNSDETRKQLQAEWMLLQSVWFIDWFLLVCLFFLIITGQQFHLKWWMQNGTWQTVFTLTGCQSVSCKATAHSCG